MEKVKTDCKDCERINKGFEDFVYCAECELKRANEKGIIIDTN